MKSLPTHKFAYTNGKVTNITEYGTDGTEGNHLNISYNADNTTVFTDKQGHSETHIFDNSGSTVSDLNSNGYATSSENTGLVINNSAKYSLQGTTQGRYLTGGVPPVRFSM